VTYVVVVLRCGHYVVAAASADRESARAQGAVAARLIETNEAGLAGMLLDGAHERGAGAAHGSRVAVVPAEVAGLALYTRTADGFAFDEAIPLNGGVLDLMGDEEFAQLEARQSEWCS
jgi:hypothetical protein